MVSAYNFLNIITHKYKFKKENSMRYEGKIFRPPPEGDSFLLQCTIGCSHNQCTFCGMYKDRKYRLRSLAEIKGDIKMAKVSLGRRLLKVFLCDGDAISIETGMLLEILSELYDAFPFLRQVSTYVGPQITLNKSIDELKQLRAAGLTMTYLGVESGDDKVLKTVRKGTTSSEMLSAGRNIVESGMGLTAMVMLGLGGRESSKAHALATAEIINQMKPHYLGILTTVPVENTDLFRQVEKGELQLLDAYETLEEMKVLIENISLGNLVIDGTHISNFLPIRGNIQKDKHKIIDEIDNTLKSKDTDLVGVAYIGQFSQGD